MSENTFDSQEINLQFQPLPAFIDTDGSFKLNTPMLSSFDFDGSIPKRDEPIDAIEVKPGYLIQIESGGEYFPVVSVEYDEPDIEDTGIVTINYIDDQGNTISADYDETDQISAVYEDWDEKVLGSQGWGITAGGNAIFTNVAVRGRIEAEEGYISGNLTIGDGGSTTLDQVATSDDLSGYIPSGSAAFDINTNVVTINGGKITAGTVTADKINTNNLIVQNLESYSTSTASRIKILDVNNERHKLQFQTGWFREVIPAFIGATAYSNPGIGFGGSQIGIDINAGTLNLGVTSLPSTIKLISRSFDPLGLERQISYESDFHWFYPLTGTVNSEFLVGGFSTVTLRNTANPPNGGTQYSISMDYINGFDITGPVTFTGNVNGTFVGNGSGLTSLNASNISSGTLGTSRLSGTYGISISGNAATATSATKSTYTNNVDSNQAGGALITGQSVTVNNVGTVTSGDYLRRDGSNYLKVSSSSTRKIKTDISILDDLDVLGIDVVKFKYIDGYLDPNDQRIEQLIPGFIAEQVYEEIPIAVDLDENNEPKNWNDRILIPIIVKTIQDQQKIIEDLQNRVLQLESQLGG